MSDDRLDQLDYYDLLQVDEGVGAEDLRRAFHAFALRYHPDRFAGAPLEKRERAAEIYRRGTEGYRVLGDAEQRRKYDAQRTRGARRFDPTEPLVKPAAATLDTAQIAVRSPRARPFATKAQEAIAREDWALAKLNLKLALQHEPGNPLLEARLVFVEHRLLAKRA